MTKPTQKNKLHAQQALVASFQTDLIELVSKYRQASEGLGVQYQSGFAFLKPFTINTVLANLSEQPDELGIWGDWEGDLYPGHRANCGYPSFVEAFKDPRPDRIGLNGVIYFVKQNNQWIPANTPQGEPNES